LKKAQTKKNFRDYDGYDCGNRRVRVCYLAGADIDAKYEGKNILGGYLFEDMQVDIREEMADPQAIAQSFTREATTTYKMLEWNTPLG